MAFHTPDPKLRAVELRNAQLRAQVFARLFGGLWRGIVRGVMFLVRLKAMRGSVMVRGLGFLMVAGLVAGCSASQTYWVNPDVSEEARERQFRTDSLECRALARERFPEPDGPAPVITLANPDWPFPGGGRNGFAYQRNPFSYVIERGERVRDRREYEEACMVDRGWQRRTEE